MRYGDDFVGAAKAHYKKLITNTKNELLALKSNNISFIMVGPSNTTHKVTIPILEQEYDCSSYVKELYGTTEKPTYGYMYSLKKQNIDQITTSVVNNIYQDEESKAQPDINEVKVIDYFPKEVVDNFTFSYEGKPSIGDVSDTIDTQTRTITWNVGTLKGEKTATLRYKLKIKNMKNTELLNKTMEASEKTVLTYKDANSKDYTVTLTSSPKIQLTEIKEETKEEKNNNSKVNNNNVKKDTTVINKNLPQTGVNTIAIVLSVVVGIAIIIVMRKKYNSYKDIK